MTPRTETVVMSELLSHLPDTESVVQEQVAGPLLRALGLTKPRVPKWVKDPHTIDSILAGLIVIDEEFGGGYEDEAVTS
jgi:hypothetical protein